VAAADVHSPGALSGFMAVMLATAWAEVQRKRAYTIEIVRWPLFPLLYFAMLLLTYRISGQETVAGYNVEGFLLVGAIGMVLWSAAIWTGGYAIEIERMEGTINSLFLTPSSRVAVITGYSLGGLAMFMLPAVIVLTILAMLTGVQFDVQSPIAVVIASFSLIFGACALGHVLASAFVLTRRANLWANFLQTPIYLLSGMVVAIEALPEWVQWFAAVFPIGAGMTALRDALLAGATVGDISEPLVRFAVSSAALLVIGSYLLKRVENVAKRGGQFDLD
jgi:ABC-2 type transport system permease protein